MRTGFARPNPFVAGKKMPGAEEYDAYGNYVVITMDENDKDFIDSLCRIVKELYKAREKTKKDKNMIELANSTEIVMRSAGDRFERKAYTVSMRFFAREKGEKT